MPARHREVQGVATTPHADAGPTRRARLSASSLWSGPHTGSARGRTQGKKRAQCVTLCRASTLAEELIFSSPLPYPSREKRRASVMPILAMYTV